MMFRVRETFITDTWFDSNDSWGAAAVVIADSLGETRIVRSQSFGNAGADSLIGNDGDKTIFAGELAQKCETIAYEIFTSVSKRVKRAYVEAN